MSLCRGTTTNRSRRIIVNTFLSITRHSQKFSVFFFAFLNSTALGKKPPAERHNVPTALCSLGIENTNV